MNRFLLVRHAENKANLTKEFSCRKIDYSLTEKGRLQAQQTAEYLRSQPIVSVYASPLKRTIETAEIIANPFGLPVQVLEEFREVDVGDLEGTEDLETGWEFHRGIVDQWYAGRSDVAFPGGEDYQTLYNRMKTGYQEVLSHSGEGIHVIVTHGGVINLALPGLCPNITLEWLQNRPVMNCSITEVEITNGLTGRLVEYASYGHLYGEAAKLVSGVPYWKAPGEQDV
ncbi:MAG: histidine phosphatase family protein [Anaerolineales bacterium]|nr:histidine phosphatase family protein [Anaerolineales bacterium]